MLLLAALQQTATVPTDVVLAVNRFTDFLLRYLIALAAVGALSMALIEALKKLFDMRTRFQALRWTRWMSRSAFDEGVSGSPAFAAAPTEEGASPNRALAYTELLQLCTGVPRDDAAQAAQGLLVGGGHLSPFHAFSPVPAHALFALDLDRMMGSIQDAADIVLASPQQNRSLYLLVTSGGTRDDISRWYTDGPNSLVNYSNPDADRQAIKANADRLARLRQIVKRKLDGFQLYTGDRWGSWNQFAANALGFLVLLGVLVWLRSTSGTGLPSDGEIVLFSILGGIFAPVAKDLVSALKRVKDG
jgi:hypothetical protein